MLRLYVLTIYMNELVMNFGLTVSELKIKLRAATARHILRKCGMGGSPSRSLRDHEYQLWLKDHLAIYGMRNALLATGYNAMTKADS